MPRKPFRGFVLAVVLKFRPVVAALGGVLDVFADTALLVELGDVPELLLHFIFFY